eukprot:jgi/Ulvmu1/12699/UM095_0003.1
MQQVSACAATVEGSPKQQLAGPSAGGVGPSSAPGRQGRLLEMMRRAKSILHGRGSASHSRVGTEAVMNPVVLVRGPLACTRILKNGDLARNDLGATDQASHVADDNRLQTSAETRVKLPKIGKRLSGGVFLPKNRAGPREGPSSRPEKIATHQAPLNSTLLENTPPAGAAASSRRVPWFKDLKSGAICQDACASTSQSKMIIQRNHGRKPASVGLVTDLTRQGQLDGLCRSMADSTSSVVQSQANGGAVYLGSNRSNRTEKHAVPYKAPYDGGPAVNADGRSTECASGGDLTPRAPLSGLQQCVQSKDGPMPAADSIKNGTVQAGSYPAVAGNSNRIASAVSSVLSARAEPTTRRAPQNSADRPRNLAWMCTQLNVPSYAQETQQFRTCLASCSTDAVPGDVGLQCSPAGERQDQANAGTDPESCGLLEEASLNAPAEHVSPAIQYRTPGDGSCNMLNPGPGQSEGADCATNDDDNQHSQVVRTAIEVTDDYREVEPAANYAGCASVGDTSAAIPLLAECASGKQQLPVAVAIKSTLGRLKQALGYRQQNQLSGTDVPETERNLTSSQSASHLDRQQEERVMGQKIASASCTTQGQLAEVHCGIRDSKELIPAEQQEALTAEPTDMVEQFCEQSQHVTAAKLLRPQTNDMDTHEVAKPEDADLQPSSINHVLCEDDYMHANCGQDFCGASTETARPPALPMKRKTSVTAPARGGTQPGDPSQPARRPTFKCPRSRR